MQKLSYSALEPLTVGGPVDRLSWLEGAVKGKVVLDLGAYDETAIGSKRGTESWLHGRLARAAREVIGVDVATEIPQGGLATSTTSRIVRGDVMQLEDVAESRRAELIVAGELIEHLPCALGFLEGLKKHLPQKELILTTPNSTAAHNVCIGVFKRESNHHDHLQVFSFKTLSTLMRRAGFEQFELIPYHARFPEMIEDSRGPKRWAVRLFELQTNLIERCCPLLSGGWIIRTRT